MILIWGRAPEFSEKQFGVYNENSSLDELLFIRGNPIDELAEKPRLDYDISSSALQLEDVMISSVNTPLVSSKLKDYLGRKQIPHLQFIPVSLRFNDKDVEDYFLLNVTLAKECIDYSSSTYRTLSKDLDPEQKTALRFTKVKMHEHELEDDLIAREAANNIVFVDQAFAEDLLDQDFSGVFFYEPSEYLL